mgnify:CR=1 FL=1
MFFTFIIVVILTAIVLVVAAMTIAKLLAPRSFKVIARNFDNMKEAIIKYYEAKFEVIKNPFKVSGKSEMYSLLHKKTKLEVAYLYVGEFLSEEDFNKISSNFVEDTVYFCITKDAEVLPNVSDREYYLKDVDDIVNKYLNQYKLKEIDATIFKIN